MIEPRTFDPRDLPGVLALWSRRWGGRFPLDRALWLQNTEGDPRHFRAERCWVVDDGGTIIGGLALKAPDAPPAWSGQHPRHGWISFLAVEPGRDRAIAPPLLARALVWLRAAGFARVSYGGDPSHFFPGAPEDDAGLRRTLEAAGFRSGEPVHDLIGDLRASQAPKDAERALRAADATCVPCGRVDVPALLAFVEREFPGRWAYDTRRRIEIEPTPADVIVVTRGRDVIGFCHVYHSGSRRIGPSIYWREAIGGQYGGLGPIGVDRAFRGRGIGSAFLALAVLHLRGLGVERAVIDWTTLVDYYGRLGFRMWRTYRPWQLDL